MNPTFPKPKDSQIFPANAAEKEAIRRKVFERDGGRCVDCKRPVVWKPEFWSSMHLMHIKSKGSGGDWSMENLATGCLWCHMKRHNAGGKPCPPKPAMESL
jgi:5-methylcytosine-specific restriction endonuclease McrA